MWRAGAGADRDRVSTVHHGLYWLVSDAARETPMALLVDDAQWLDPGNPELAAQALLDTLDRDDPPFRLLLGNVAYDVAVDRYEAQLSEFRAGEQVARGADDR